MIGFGTAITDSEAYRRYAQPGIERAAEPGSRRYLRAAVESLPRSLNLVLDMARADPELEALVLVAEYVEIADSAFCSTVRDVLADPAVAIVGVAGARGVRSLAWWEGQVFAASARTRYNEVGGGELPAFQWASPRRPPADVDVLDGRLLVLGRWALDHVRFDESLIAGDGFEIDLCMRARSAGRKVSVAELPVVYHQELELIDDLGQWTENHIRAAERWAEQWGRPTEGEDAWKARARRAEAEREAARSIAYSSALKLDARVEQLTRELERKLESRSWRLTEPLRWANRMRRALRERAVARRTDVSSGGSIAEHAPDLGLGDGVVLRSDAGPHTGPGEPLGEPERARAQ
jgi:hypothetical protein